MTTTSVDLSIEAVLGTMSRDDTPEEASAHREVIGELIRHVQYEGSKTKYSGDGSIDALATIDGWLADIDKRMGALMDDIIHHERFRELERAWRGLWYLVSNTETSAKLRIRVLPVRRTELVDELKRAADFEQTALFRRIYEEEFGTLGGDPYAVMLLDFYFGQNAADIATMRRLAEIGASAHTPFIAAAAAQMFKISDYREIGKRQDMRKVFDTTSYASWRSLRSSEDSRYFALVLPRMLLRLPYDPDGNRAEGFRYTESHDEHEHYCWGNVVYALGQRITEAFAFYGWTAAIRGVEGGGKVATLPIFTYSDRGESVAQIPTEVAISDRRERELAELGFSSLCYAKGEDYAVFFSTPTIQEPRRYDTDEANANAKLSAQLQYLLAASRFAHYIKSIMRNKIGSFLSRTEVQGYLTRWISAYVLLSDDASQPAKARFPLREARVVVDDVPGNPGAYQAVIFLRPHYQLDELTASIRLVAALPEAGT